MGLDVSLIQKDPGPDEDGYLADLKVFYSKGVTHNLGKMAREAGVYLYLWRPEELGFTEASDLLKPLEEGLMKLQLDPYHYKTFDSSNGWGTYEDLIRFMKSYLAACREYPSSVLYISR